MDNGEVRIDRMFSMRKIGQIGQVDRKCIVSGGMLTLLALLLVACGNGSTMTPARSLSVQIVESDFHISSSLKRFTPGVTYHFIIRNNGHTAHEFMLMPLAMSTMDGMSISDMDQMSLADVGAIIPGQVRTLDYTIPASVAGSQLQFACHYPGHYQAGMSLNVTVSA
jgi:uncharacterized cupredoxin-like copper-binding protein